MRRLFGIWIALAVIAGGVSHAQSLGIREVTASDRSLVALNTKLRYTTMIILPDGEEIVDVICGDRDFWVISATHNIAHVKPAKEGAMTNLNLVATSGAIYSFLLSEGKAPTPDLKVYVTSSTVSEGTKRKYLTVTQVDEQVAALENEVKQAQGAVEAAQTIAARSIAEAKARAPLAMHFPYEPVPYTRPFLIRSIWHDGTFTYIKTEARELPALYEIKDGQPALVNFQSPAPDTYVVPKVLKSGYFVIGKQRLSFKTRTSLGD